MNASNKIIFAAIVLFIGLGILGAAGSVINASFGYVEEETITYELTTTKDLYFYPDDYGLTQIQMSYIFNNFPDIYKFTIEQNGNTYTIVDNFEVLDSNFSIDPTSEDFLPGGYQIDDNISTVIFLYSTSFSRYIMYIANDPITFNSQTIDIDSTDVDSDPATERELLYPITLTFEFLVETYTPLGRLTTVATIIMVLSVLSTATYFTLKGRATA